MNILLKYFRTAWLVRKLNARKYMRNINDNVVQDRLSEKFNAKIYRMRYFRHEIFAIYSRMLNGYKIFIESLLNLENPACLQATLASG